MHVPCRDKGGACMLDALGKPQLYLSGSAEDLRLSLLPSGNASGSLAALAGATYPLLSGRHPRSDHLAVSRAGGWEGRLLPACVSISRSSAAAEKISHVRLISHDCP